jgi:hypothetical protein
METTATNPLSRVAFGVPAQAANAASKGGRAVGALIAIAIAFDQSYDPTQVFASVVAAVVAATLLPMPRPAGDWVSALGAGTVFFAGTLLTHMGLGLALLAVGALAGAASFALPHRQGRDSTLPALAFLLAVFFVAALQVLVVFAFE